MFTYLHLIRKTSIRCFTFLPENDVKEMASEYKKEKKNINLIWMGDKQHDLKDTTENRLENDFF